MPPPQADPVSGDDSAPATGPPASLTRNTLAQSASLLTAYALSFVSAPIILNGLGLRLFGIWAVTGALASYAALLDLGVGISLSRYIAAHAEDRRACGCYTTIGLLTTAVSVAALFPVAVVGAAPLSHALGGISAGDMRVVLYSGLTILGCQMLTGTLAAFPIGQRRMVAPNVGYLAGSVANFIASVGSIELGAGLRGYALANAGAGIVAVALMAALVVWSEGTPPLARPGISQVREFVAFSIKTQLVRVSDLVNYETDKLVIAFAIGPAVAGAYELANRVASAVRSVAILVASAVSVELTALTVRSGLDAMRARYARLTEVAAAFAFPPVLLTMATAPLLLSAWLSHAPPHATIVLIALTVAYLLSVSTGVGYSVAIAAGKPGIVARTSVAASASNIVLTVALAPVLGLWGVLIGTVVALSSGAIAQVVLIHRAFSFPAKAYLQGVLPALTRCAALAVPVAAISYAQLVHSRVGDAALLVILAIAYLAACAAWAMRAGRVPAAMDRYLPRWVWLRRGLVGRSDAVRRSG